MSPVPLMTAEELLLYQPPDAEAELIKGRMVVREPPSAMHGRYAARIAFLLMQHVIETRAGAVLADGGFHIESNPDTVLAPDVAFIVRDRVLGIPETGFARMAPDLAVEVRSPGDRWADLLRKVSRWLGAGVRVVWVIDPRQRSAHLFRPDGDIVHVPEDGDLTGDDVLPCFRCALRRVLALE
ncbi:MAG: Uma2 family endonuclease [Gemmatimonadaceae bacterium]|nr:Uma2 family endonuclease [Gemmatimonadaceae bacterium]